MKNLKWSFLIPFLASCSRVHSGNDYYCFTAGKSSVLLVSTQYSKINNIKYFPYMKNILLSRPFDIEEIHMGEC